MTGPVRADERGRNRTATCNMFRFRGSVKMEIERTPRKFRRSHLAPIGAYSSDDDGLIALLGARASECWKIAGERQSEF